MSVQAMTSVGDVVSSDAESVDRECRTPMIYWFLLRPEVWCVRRVYKHRDIVIAQLNTLRENLSSSQN